MPVRASAPGSLDADQRQSVIEEALRSLPPHQRVPLVLYHFEEFSYLEIAASWGVSLAKVKTDIARGRAALLPVLGCMESGGGGNE